MIALVISVPNSLDVLSLRSEIELQTHRSIYHAQSYLRGFFFLPMILPLYLPYADTSNNGSACYDWYGGLTLI